VALRKGCEEVLDLDYPIESQQLERLWLVVDSVNVLERILQGETGQKRNRAVFHGISFAIQQELREYGFNYEIVTLFTSLDFHGTELD
jgi:hypothetical protein